MNSLISKLSNKVKDPTLLLGAMSAFSVKIVAAGGAFLLNLCIARSLGTEQAGYFFLTQAICVVIASISRQGFDNALVRFVAGFKVNDDHSSIMGIFKYSATKVLLFSVITSVTIFLFSDFIGVEVFNKPLLVDSIRIGAWLIIPLSLIQILASCFQGVKLVVYAMIYQSALLAVLAVVSIWLLSPNNSASAMTVYTVCAFIVAMFAYVQWMKTIRQTNGHLKADDRYAVNQAVKPLFLILLMSQTTQWAGQLMLGAWSTAHDVALYATAQRTAMLVSFILVAVNAIAAPKFAEAFKKKRYDEIEQVAISSSRLMTATAIPVLIFMIVFAPWLMSLFGPDFVDGAVILRILVIGQFVNVITGSVGYLLQMTANESVLRNNMVISSIILVVGSIFAIPLFGVIGAAVVTSFSVAIQNLLCVYQVKKKLGFNTLNIF